MRKPLRTLLLSASLCLGAASLPRAGDHWPQFRGPTGQGLTDSTGVPLNWSETQNVKWKTPIHGRSWSSPVIWGNQVWLTTATEDGRYLSALCVDKETGKIVHDLRLFEDPTPNPVFKKFNTHA